MRLPTFALLTPPRPRGARRMFRWGPAGDSSHDAGRDRSVGLATQTTDCPPPSHEPSPQEDSEEQVRGPVASAATAIMLLGACSDDGPTTLNDYLEEQ